MNFYGSQKQNLSVEDDFDDRTSLSEKTSIYSNNEIEFTNGMILLTFDYYYIKFGSQCY